MSARADELLSEFLEGDLDPAGVAELDALLAADPALAERAAGLVEVHRGVGFLAHGKRGDFPRAVLDRIRVDRDRFVGSVTSQLRSAAPPRPWVALAAVAAGVLLFLGLIAGALRTPPSPAGPVATLVASSKARWEPQAGFPEGHRFVPGPLRLSGGRAVLQFDGGALAVLEGPADLAIESRGSARLRHGRLHVRAGEEAAGFTVRTPAGEAVDLGTEFRLDVALSGESELHVQQGEVSWASSGSAPRVLKAGEALRSSGGQERSVAFLALSIDDFLRQLAAEVQPARASAVEDFEYEPGRHEAARLDGGAGWTGPWRRRWGLELTREPDTFPALGIVPDSLRGSGRGGALELPPGNTVAIRSLAEPVDLGRDSVHYFSFAARRLADAAPGAAAPPHLRFTLRSSADYWGPSVTAGLPLSRRPTLQVQGRDNYVAPRDLETGVASLWVLKIVAGRVRPDEVFLRVFRADEAVPAFEPASWSVVTGPVTAEGLLDLVVLTGSGPATHVVDALRAGRTWDSVIRRD